MTNVLDLDSLKLAFGGHSSPEAGMCLLEAASYLAGEPFSDHPACVSGVIGAYGRRLNDLLGDDDRQRLKAFIPAMLGTSGDGKDEKRRLILADWAYRAALPRWLSIAGNLDLAKQLMSLPEFTSWIDVRNARNIVTTGWPYETRRKARQESRRVVREAVKKHYPTAATTAATAVAVEVVAAATEAAVAVAATVVAVEVVAAATEAAVEVVAAATEAEAAVAATATVATAAEVAEAAAEVAEAAATEAAEAAEAFPYREFRKAFRAKLDELDPSTPGTFAYVRRVNLDEGIALLGRLIEGV